MRSRGYAGIDLNHDLMPDATTLLKFRHWLEQHERSRWHKRHKDRLRITRERNGVQRSLAAASHPPPM
jgi:IS5 family transposase